MALVGQLNHNPCRAAGAQHPHRAVPRGAQLPQVLGPPQADVTPAAGHVAHAQVALLQVQQRETSRPDCCNHSGKKWEDMCHVKGGFRQFQMYIICPRDLKAASPFVTDTVFMIETQIKIIGS